MSFLKSQWRVLVIGTLALASLGGGGWAYTNGGAVEERMKQVDGLLGKIRTLQRDPVNTAVIDAEKVERQRIKEEFEKSMADALAMQKESAFDAQRDQDGRLIRQPRKLLVDDVLPESRSSVRIQFKEAYKREFERLRERLKGRSGPTFEEVQRHRAEIDALRSRPADEDQVMDEWESPPSAPKEAVKTAPERERSLSDLLREHAPARAADEVARSTCMYINDNAIGMHDLVGKETAPGEVEVWQAQMALWIQQDLIAALSLCNDERVEQLKKQNVAPPYWVGQMPVKHLMRLCIDDALGQGGGSGRCQYPQSFTGVKNDDKMFMVPIQLHLVVEEASLALVLDRITRIGFYTPIRVDYVAVEPELLFVRENLFIYGDDPAVRVTIDLEGYYFRQVYDQWIPKSLKSVMSRPGARLDPSDRGGGDASGSGGRD